MLSNAWSESSSFMVIMRMAKLLLVLSAIERRHFKQGNGKAGRVCIRCQE